MQLLKKIEVGGARETTYYNGLNNSRKRGGENPRVPSQHN